MKLKTLILLVMGCVLGWFAACLLKSPGAAPEESNINRQTISLLGERTVSDPRNATGLMSAQLSRVAQWASSVSLDDPKPVLDTVDRLATATLRETARGVLTRRWIEEDPLTALTLSQLALDHETRKSLVNALTKDQLIEALKREPGIEKKLFSALAVVDPGKALEIVQERGLMNHGIIYDIVAGLIENKHGFERTAAAVEQLPTLVLRGQATSTLVELWTKEDAAGALEWIQSLPDRELFFFRLREWGPHCSEGQSSKSHGIGFKDQ